MRASPYPASATIIAGGATLDSDLAIEPGAAGVVVIASRGASRVDPRNRYVASALSAGGFGTLLSDLITSDEEHTGRARDPRAELDLLATRLESVVRWLAEQPITRGLPIGLLGAGTGAAAVLVAAARAGAAVGAVVAVGGRPDLAGDALAGVRAPTLLIVGGRDEVLVALARRAGTTLAPHATLHVIDDASQRFTEPGTLDEADALAVEWFRRHLGEATITRKPPLWMC